MATPDYFTRLIALNAMGPNVRATSATFSDLAPKWECSRCCEVHDSEFSAEACCQPEVLKVYQCPACDETFGKKEEALGCCGNGAGQPKQCPVCLGPAEEYQQAADCCLHTHPGLTAHGRERIAELVAAGTPWPEAVATVVGH